MEVFNLMSYDYESCNINDLITEVENKMLNKKKGHIIVEDDKARYKGVVSVLDILKAKDKNQRVEQVTNYIETVDVTTELTEVNTTNDIIPVQKDYSIVGIIEFKDLISFLKERKLQKKVINKKDNEDDNSKAKYTIDSIIGESSKIKEMKRRLIKTAKINSTVLIRGETGVGKELVAHAIVSLSKRRYQPFVKVNCGAIPENLIEAELFGYDKGTFTGGLKEGKEGKFKLANNGTIFLDEIGEMDLKLQTRLLRVIEEREIVKIGGDFPESVDVRIIAATNVDLEQMVERNEFRKDLYYRLNVIPVDVPPLRDYKDDIPLLVEYYIDKISQKFDVRSPVIEEDVFKILKKYKWPGNVRELINVIERAIVLSDDRITVDDFKEISSSIDESGVGAFNNNKNNSELKSSTYEAEKDMITKYLKKHNYNKVRAADDLGISRSSLYYKMKKYDIAY
ncbi:sigma 54-interacting transcriptional regulator [Natroniella sp. ANB-PHB2]|uniref:sigma 54-interacting transcriptional regulator n=1 Tax=Natroniella sp. ANB-PHB2 TaxID=3384444 RepID=UPI0038D515CD